MEARYCACAEKTNKLMQASDNTNRREILYTLMSYSFTPKEVFTKCLTPQGKSVHYTQCREYSDAKYACQEFLFLLHSARKTPGLREYWRLDAAFRRRTASETVVHRNNLEKLACWHLKS